MANVTYDIMWREGMMELLDQLEAENPEDINLAPKVRNNQCALALIKHDICC